MVQAQAIACNLPLVGTSDSGAEDLMKMVENPEYITIIKEFTSSSLLKAIHDSLNKQKEIGNLLFAGSAISNLTWEAYGNRYTEFLNKL